MRIVRSPFKILLVSASLILFVAFSVVAQPGDPVVDPDIPITGIEILVALGGMLGVKKLIARKKSN